VAARLARVSQHRLAFEEAAMSTGTARIRVVEGRQVPPPGRWDIDPSHSSVQFVARHMMISKVRGRFGEISGTVHIADVPERSSVEVVIQAASIETGDAERDRHLRSADFLDVERFPEINYRSTAVRPADGDRWEVTGDLTVRGVTRPVVLDVEFEGAAVDPWHNLRAGFLATTEINREEFDVTWNQVLETGGFLVGKGIRVEADVEAVRSSGG
jgi:polyisoprenoid-binding protein YceI